MIDFHAYKNRKGRTPCPLGQRKAVAQAKSITFIHRRMSPFCDPLSRRPCVTVCAPWGGRRCTREEERRRLIFALSSSGNPITIGNMKVNCLGECADGLIVGFPHREFFYIGISSKHCLALPREIQSGRIVFELLSINSRRSYRNDIYYDRNSGFLAAIDEHVCMVQVAKYFLDFEDGVSCGKCVPCRIGVIRAQQSVNRLIAGRGEPADIERIKTLCGIMRMTPDCDYATRRCDPFGARSPVLRTNSRNTSAETARQEYAGSAGSILQQQKA